MTSLLFESCLTVVCIVYESSEKQIMAKRMKLATLHVDTFFVTLSQKEQFRSKQVNTIGVQAAKQSILPTTPQSGSDLGKIMVDIQFK